MNAKNDLLVKKLEQMASKTPLSIETVLAKEALSRSDASIVNFFLDLLQYDCVSGMIPSLVYYVDTHKFYDFHYAQIEEIRQEYELQIGKAISVKGDYKNYMSWFAYEYVAYELAQQLGILI